MRTIVVFAGLASSVMAAPSEIDYSSALPKAKAPVEIALPWNPIVAQRNLSPDAPLPLKRDKDDPALKLPPILLEKIRSVVFSETPILLIDGRVFRVGDEIKLGGAPILPKNQTFLKAILDDRLLLTVVSLDPAIAGQVEVAVLLPSAMRKDAR